MRRFAFWIFISMCFLAQLVSAQEKHPLTFEEFFTMDRVTDPRPSPDGQWIAYSVQKYDIEQNNANSDIWLISANGTQQRQLTHSAASESSPRWSPDGTQIAFAKGGQIWLIPADGGESRQVTGISTGASGPAWSADGKKLLFTSTVYPECEDDDCNKRKLDNWKNSNVKAQIWDGLMYRHWNDWTYGKRNHVFICDAKTGAFTDLTPGDFDAPPISLGGSPDYAISPDGSEVCFVKNTDPVVATSTNNDLFIVPASGGDARQITTNKANDNNPVYSPDGTLIAYVAMARPGFEADRQVVHIYQRATGTITALTEALDRSAHELVWSPDGKYIYFTANDVGYNSIYRVEVTTQKIKQITEKAYNNALTVTSKGKLVFTREAINKPADVWIANADGSMQTQLTFHNKDVLAKIEMKPWEEFWFEGAEGVKVHGQMVKPPQFDASKKYPLIYLVHGGPQGAWSDNFHYRWNAQMFAAPGYVVVMINPRGSTGYGQQFTDDISGDWGGKVFVDLQKGWEYVVANYAFIDSERMGAAGASYGGYMMYWFEGHEQPFKCLISHDGVYNLESMYGTTEELWFPEWEQKGAPWENPELYERWSPSSYVKNFSTPMLIIHSQKDYRVDLGQGLEAFTALQRMGVPSKFLYFPDEDHFVRKPQNAQLWWETMHGWFAKYLK